MEDQPKSLKSVFQQAERRRLALEASHEPRSPRFQDDLLSAIEDYQECLQLISNVSLFSPNESAEDISTADLPYLLVNYWIAELLQKTSEPSPTERARVLDRAREAYERYLHLLDSYSLLSPAYAKLFRTYHDDPTSFSTVSTADPTARRNAKISNFRAEKELRQKLDLLRHRPEYLNGGEDGDDEAARAVHLAHVAFCTHMTFQALEGLNRELEILAQAPVPLLPQTTSIEEDERRRKETLSAEGFSERLDPPFKRLTSTFGGNGGPLLTQGGKPLQPFTLVNSRQELAKGVFRPGHNLPTMSIDDYLDEERRRGGIIEGGGEASLRTEEPNEDDMERADAETMKARAWDEFTEANPRGSGNTLNRG